MSATTTTLPDMFDIEVDADTIEAGEHTLLGGSPFRVLRLTSTGVEAWCQIRSGERPLSPSARVLAQTLIGYGMAHPRPQGTPTQRDVTVIIPVFGRQNELRRCLDALGSQHRIIVVDDGSADASAIADICAAHGAEVIHRPRNGGPAAARNSGLDHVDSEFVAFIDSDCVVTGDWVDSLGAHFDDPLVGAVAPRVEAAHGGSGVVDLGDRPGRVAPLTRIGHVPTAALLVRRQALETIASKNSVFDEDLRVGEDVDLVWRLVDAGWVVRYDPTVTVEHHEPAEISAVMARRASYGTSAAPLSARHPGKIVHFVGLPFPVATCLFAWARWPRLFLAALAMTVARTHSSLAPTGASRDVRTSFALRSIQQTWLALSTYVTQFFAPLALLSICFSSRRWTTLGLVVTAPLTHDQQHPVRHWLSEVAYGSGVWRSVVDHRDLTPVLPRRWKPAPSQNASAEPTGSLKKPKGRP